MRIQEFCGSAQDKTNLQPAPGKLDETTDLIKQTEKRYEPYQPMAISRIFARRTAGLITRSDHGYIPSVFRCPDSGTEANEGNGRGRPSWPRRPLSHARNGYGPPVVSGRAAGDAHRQSITASAGSFGAVRLPALPESARQPRHRMRPDREPPLPVTVRDRPAVQEASPERPKDRS